MNVALVGDDPRLLDWAQTIAASGDVLTECATDVAMHSEWHQSCRAAVGETIEWPSTPVDAAIVAGNSRRTAHLAEKLAATTRLLILPDVRHSATGIAALEYGIDAERQLVPFLPWRHDRFVRRLLVEFQQGVLGDLQLVRLERAQTADVPGGRISLVTVRDQFFHDFDLLALIVGEFDRLTALRVGGDASSVAQFTIGLSGAGTAEASWTLEPGPASQWTLVVTGTSGDARLECDSQGGRRLLINAREVAVSSPSRPTTSGSRPTPDSRVAAAANDDELRQRAWQAFRARSCDPAGPSPPEWQGESVLDELLHPRWEHYSRQFAADAALRESLRRQRTVPIARHGVSERGEFKSQMTALGCGVLTWTLLGTLGGLLVGQVFDPRDSLERRAAAEQTLVWNEDVTDGEGGLSPLARERLQLRFQQPGPQAIVLVESPPDPSNSVARTTTLQSVRQLWESSKPRADAVPPQIEVRDLRGRGFGRLMLGVWTITFAPLGLFLAAQGLIRLARPHDSTSR